METSEDTKNVIVSRAKEIDTGAFPLPLSNVLLGLPYKPDSTVSVRTGAKTRPWTYGDLVTQEKLIGDISIKLETTSALSVWKFHNTWENVLKTHFSSDFRRIFGIKSWTLNFRFEVRSNFQQVGMLNLVYSNLPKNCMSYHFDSRNAGDPFSIFQNQTQLPHRKIMMGEDQDVNVSLKWISPHMASFGADMYNPDGSYVISDVPNYDNGTLFLYVPFPMQVASGVHSQLTVRVWSWLSDFTYGAYKPIDSVL